MPRTLVVSAFEPEIAPLRRRLDGRRDVQTATVGIGAVDAAIGATRAIAAHRPGCVIFVGTAGVYPASARAVPIGTAAIAGEVRLVSTAALRGEAYHPAPLVAPATLAHCARDEAPSRPPWSLMTRTRSSHDDVAPAIASNGRLGLAMPDRKSPLSLAVDAEEARRQALGRALSSAAGRKVRDLNRSVLEQFDQSAHDAK